MNRLTGHTIWLFALLLAACGPAGGPQPISEKRSAVRKPAIPPGAGTVERFGYVRNTGGSGSRVVIGPYEADLPQGWKRLPPRQFRDGNFQVKGRADVDAFVTVLGGGGGGIAGNLNRWRGQMGLPALGVAEMTKLPRIPMLGGTGVLLEMDGTFQGKTGQRMLAAIILDGSTAVSVKMIGPSAFVTAEKGGFLALSRSLRKAGAAAPPGGNGGNPHAMGGGPGPGSFRLTWDPPKGWVKAPAKSGSIVTFRPGGNEKAECYVRTLGGSGDVLLSFVNILRQQMGAGPLSDADLAGLPTVKILGEASPLMELTGDYLDMRGGRSPGYMMMVAVRALDDRSILVKMTGPEDVVRPHRDAFVAFCQSIGQ